MERINKFAKVIRNNWKKSTVAAVALCYGAGKVKEKYEINVLMRAACKEATKYGDMLIPMDRNPTLVTVILNPVANKRKAKQDYEKYCEPLLHLAGLQVDVIQTTSEGNAKDLVESLKGTEAIIVAGGDGTLAESITGLLRRSDNANQFPLGILPLGRTNTIGNTLFPGGSGVDKVRQLIEASMAIIKGNTIWRDAIKVEPIATDEETASKPIYAMSSLEWGAFRDTFARTDKYWLYGFLRGYAAFIFNGYKNNLTWDCSGTIRYTKPCDGCGNCLEKKPEVKRKWLFFIPKTEAVQPEKAVNPECAEVHELCFKTSDFEIFSPNVKKIGDRSALNIKLGKPSYTYVEFVNEGWKRLKGVQEDDKFIAARTIELLPRTAEDPEKADTIEIDKEEFDAKPVKITLLPKVVKLFCRPGQEYMT